MDRNQLTGLLAMLVLFLLYFQFFAPDPPVPQAEEAPQVDTTTVEAAPSPIEEVVQETLSDSAAQALQQLKYGAFSVVSEGEERTTTLETDKLLIDFSSKGGFIRGVTLKDYTSYDDTPLQLMVPEKSNMDILFEHQSKNLSFKDLYFESSVERYQDSIELSYRVNLPDGSALVQIYTLYNGLYELGYRIESKGFERQIAPKNLILNWDHKANRIEPHLKDPRNRTTVRYATADGSVDYLSATSTSREEEKVEDLIQWIAFKQKYFTSASAAESNFSSAWITSAINEADETTVKYMTMTTEIPFTDLANGTSNFKLFFGPNSYYTLEAFAPEFTENLNLGWSILSFVNKYLILPIWRGLETFISNYPLLIIVLVIIIRLILSPLTYKSHMSMAKMRVLKPELDEIKEKHGEDMQKAQQEQMALYQKVGINPLSGCIPMVLQFPILVALFYYIPNAIELRQVSFLWAKDLSTYDAIVSWTGDVPLLTGIYGNHISLFTILMCVSTILFTVANSQMTTVQGPMKSLQYLMPIMLLFFFNSYASGLTYYYFVSNIVSFGQIFLFRRIIDEDKIKKILDENRKKNANKKKSKFQSRLEEAMKASEEARKKGKKKK
ncbi:MAG: membrane protein insertase YidC [Bacteroidota bacterium]